MSPAIPTRVKFASGISYPPARLTNLLKTNPTNPPTISVGPNVPPTPPPALVNDIASTLIIRTARKNIGIAQGFVRISPKIVFPIACSVLLFSKEVKESYPSP